MSETNLLKFQLLCMKHFTFLYVLQNIPHKKGGASIDPSSYAINLLIAYVEILFTFLCNEYKRLTTSVERPLYFLFFDVKVCKLFVLPNSGLSSRVYGAHMCR